MEKCDYGCGQDANYTLKNGKKCCSKSPNSCPAIRKKNSDASENRYFKVRGDHVKVNCSFCNKEIIKTNLKRHEDSCYMNPINLKICPVCGSLVKNYKKSTTCSYACANTLFRSGKNNPNWSEDNYRSICFEHHEKKCIICGEENIVAVHHYDENHENNDPANLIPLCPTHHQYMHSNFKYLIEKQVDDYVKKI